MEAPLTGRPCLAYALSPGRTSGLRQSVPFVLEDATGSVRVESYRASLLSHERPAWNDARERILAPGDEVFVPDRDEPKFPVATGRAHQFRLRRPKLTLRLRLIDGVASVSLQSSTASSTGASSGSAACPQNDPSFALTISFDPLPASVSAAKPSAALASNQGAPR